MTKKSKYEIHIFSSITLYILFQIRSRRQKEMIEGGYHGLEGGFEARRRGKRGKGRFWVLNAWNFHSAPPILTLPLATFPTASTTASRRHARGARCCLYCCCLEVSSLNFVLHSSLGLTNRCHSEYDFHVGHSEEQKAVVFYYLAYWTETLFSLFYVRLLNEASNSSIEMIFEIFWYICLTNIKLFIAFFNDLGGRYENSKV